MQYMLLIYSNEEEGAKRSEAEMQEYIGAYGKFTEGIVASGHFKAGDALLPVNTARSVKVRDGKLTAVDGPFAETKEQLGGYYLVDCESVEDAIEIAGRIPTAAHGTIEVRPVMVWE